MQRKGNPSDLYPVLFLQPFNTPGDEIAPRSDVIGENLQNDSPVLVQCHNPLFSCFDMFHYVSSVFHETSLRSLERRNAGRRVICILPVALPFAKIQSPPGQFGRIIEFL